MYNLIHIHRSTVSPDTTNADLTCFILKNGSLHPIAQAMTIPSQQTSSSTSTSPARAPTPAALPSAKHASPIPAELSTETIPGLNVTPVELLKRVRKRERLSRYVICFIRKQYILTFSFHLDRT